MPWEFLLLRSAAPGAGVEPPLDELDHDIHEVGLSVGPHDGRPRQVAGAIAMSLAYRVAAELEPDARIRIGSDVPAIIDVATRR